jgi:hypothetical protein
MIGATGIAKDASSSSQIPWPLRLFYWSWPLLPGLSRVPPSAVNGNVAGRRLF